MNQAPTSDSARPSHPMCSSHSLRFQMSAFGVPLGTVGPGTKIKVTTRMITIGMTALHISKVEDVTVSCSVKGNLENCQTWSRSCEAAVALFHITNLPDVGVVQAKRPPVRRDIAQEDPYKAGSY